MLGYNAEYFFFTDIYDTRIHKSAVQYIHFSNY